jgi:hypothetical protein
LLGVSMHDGKTVQFGARVSVAVATFVVD